jgi:hypothetical protein
MGCVGNARRRSAAGTEIIIVVRIIIEDCIQWYMRYLERRAGRCWEMNDKGRIFHVMKDTTWYTLLQPRAQFWATIIRQGPVMS